jgi:hypothetical protein
VRLVSPAQLDDQDAQRLAALSELNRPNPLPADLGAFVRSRWQIMRNARNSGENNLNDRLLRAQRMFEGKYDPSKLHEIKRFGGSEVYARVVAVKCRGANSLLRDVYLGPERPWSIDPQPAPPVPQSVRMDIMQLVQSEVQNLQMGGQPIDEDQVHQRVSDLLYQAQQAARRQAMRQADQAADKVEDLLQAGNFYDALAEFLTDLPLFPFACIKGPVVRMVPRLSWQDGKAILEQAPQMFWERIDPFNIYWSPGVARIENAEVIERKRLTRTDLNDLLGLPGYDQEAVRAALQDHAHGLRDWMDSPDTEAALASGREDPNFNQSQMIDAIEYHGNVQGQILLDQGVDRELVPDLDRDYAVQTWVVGRHVLKTQLNPSPRQRHPYFLTSFEKVPGTVAGHGLPDILEDIQEVANATMRALVNNMGMASGPQVVINDDCLSPTENGDQLYPWKRWHVVNDPLANTREPVTFFQPSSNAQELLTIYQQFTNIADDISAIPRYTTGESLSGGAGRTASGLSMLMNNASKILQTVASNVDIDVMKGLLTAVYDMIMLTDDSGMLSGEEQIVVSGVKVAIQKESERQKQLQFLQITANPIDAPILGKPGRARVLRSVAQNLGMPDDVVPDDQAIAQQIKAEEDLKKAQIAMAAHSAAMQGQLGRPAPPEQQGGPGGGGAGGKPPASPAAQAQGAQAPAPTPERLSDNAPPMNVQQQMSPREGAGGARRAPDGRLYAPDPSRPGKFLLVQGA